MALVRMTGVAVASHSCSRLRPPHPRHFSEHVVRCCRIQDRAGLAVATHSCSPLRPPHPRQILLLTQSWLQHSCHFLTQITILTDWRNAFW
jgi:hypothetical protein